MSHHSILLCCRQSVWIGIAFAGLVATPSLRAKEPQAAPSPVTYTRDIRPILSDNCFRCHGPDGGSRKADLRLDKQEAAFADLGGYHAIVPGDAEDSELFLRITDEDDSYRMPPVDSGQTLKPREIALIRQWIEQGADYAKHWSLIAPQRPSLPEVVSHPRWPKNEIDYFVLSRMEKEGLHPQPRADKQTLIRRVSLDLTGLPPTPDEVDAFLDDKSPGAYEKVVDRLLRSPNYGEKMAVAWLDAARYADTHGYLFDTERSMWRWRDWVIDAYNANMPFDEFTVEQLAGDLLPEPTLSQQIATGFNRNHVINNEAGAIAAEYLVENVLDRVNTTSTVWMGMTFRCAQCHDHKYDPITQREFYELYAIFNAVPELGLDGFNNNAAPAIPAPTETQRQRMKELDHEIKDMKTGMASLNREIEEGQNEWEADFDQAPVPVQDGLLAYWSLDENTNETIDADHKTEFKDGPATFQGGLLGMAAELDGLRYLDAGDRCNFDVSDSFTLSAWIYPTQKKGRRAVFSRMEGAEQSYRGYSLQLIEGSLSLFMLHRFPDDLMQVQVKSVMEPHEWHHVTATYDGSGKAAGIQLFIDGHLEETAVVADTLKESFSTSQPLLLGSGQPGAMFLGRMDEVRVYDHVLTEDEIKTLPGVAVESLVAVAKEERNDEQSSRIRGYYLEHGAPAEWRGPYQDLVSRKKAKSDLARSMPTVMVMGQLEKPRETHMLNRGAYNQPGDLVTPGTPAALPPMDEDLPRNRLGFARWLTDPSHPLTARVTVNRFWQSYFEHGLVKTSEDFGQQGEWPSHPELLDWLATEFVSNGWDVKRMQKLIVTSATYCQSSKTTARQLEVDPENRLLSRGARLRLPAEFIRDQALAVSGLLVETIGGPSVKPYQPADLWREVAFDTSGLKLTAQIYEQDKGQKLYRRSMYTFWKRTSPPPTMLVFDAPDRERCVVQRSRTNTPLQALVTMNDPTFVEASRKLAERMMQEGSADPAEAISYAFRLATARRPSQQELAPLVEAFQTQREYFTKQPDAAKALLQVGESPRLESLDPCDLAAYTTIANIILNLDETLTKS